MDSSQTTTAVKSPVDEPGPDRSTRIPPFTNGLLKLRQPPAHAPPPSDGTYKECLKNHAAAMGGHAVDGCGEFMPSPTYSPSDPTSLRCAACGCHRNFHRRDPNSPHAPLQIEYQPHHRHHPPPPPPPRSPSSPSPPPISSTYYPSAPHMLLALSNPNPNPNTNPSPNSSSRKRFRTKFTQNQKDKMHELAEKLEWKMQRKDDDVINGFCNSIGVEKGVFKVWMHNNKNTMGAKKENSLSNNNNGSNGIGINLENAPMANDYRNIFRDPVTANGSSSSSRD